MSVPQIYGIHIIGSQHIQILDPQVLIVEPREVLRGIGIFIDTMFGQDKRLLHTDTSTAHLHLRCIGDGCQPLQIPMHEEILLQSVGSVDSSGSVVTGYHHLLPLLGDGESLSRFLFLDSNLYRVITRDIFQDTGRIVGLRCFLFDRHLYLRRHG